MPSIGSYCSPYQFQGILKETDPKSSRLLPEGLKGCKKGKSGHEGLKFHRGFAGFLRCIFGTAYRVKDTAGKIWYINKRSLINWAKANDYKGFTIAQFNQMIAKLKRPPPVVINLAVFDMKKCPGENILPKVPKSPYYDSLTAPLAPQEMEEIGGDENISSKPLNLALQRRLASDLKAVLPDMKLSRIEDNGDCFYEAYAQGLSAALDQEVTGKELRRVVKAYADKYPENSWINTSHSDKQHLIDWKQQVEDDYTSATRKGSVPFWGAPELDGLILSRHFGVNMVVLGEEYNDRFNGPTKALDLILKEENRVFSYQKYKLMEEPAAKNVHIAYFGNHFMAIVPKTTKKAVSAPPTPKSPQTPRSTLKKLAHTPKGPLFKELRSSPSKKKSLPDVENTIFQQVGDLSDTAKNSLSYLTADVKKILPSYQLRPLREQKNSFFEAYVKVLAVLEIETTAEELKQLIINYLNSGFGDWIQERLSQIPDAPSHDEWEIYCENREQTPYPEIDGLIIANHFNVDFRVLSRVWDSDSSKAIFNDREWKSSPASKGQVILGAFESTYAPILAKETS